MKKVVIFGGGSGLSNILRSIKTLDIDLTVFVTVSDNGGSTGKIREYYSVPAPGDLRRTILALSDNEKIEELMNYRFDEKIDNHTIGNLILAALINIEDDVEVAVRRYCEMLGVKRKIFPVTLDNVHLSAVMNNGDIITGECEIVGEDSKIERVFYSKHRNASERVMKSINEADYILFSSGSLFTSVLSNLVFDNILYELPKTKAKKIYISNLMTEKGETDNYSLMDHINKINEHFSCDVIDCVIGNNKFDVDPSILEKYKEEGAEFVQIEEDYLTNKKINFYLDNYINITENKHIRHNTDKISQTLMKIFGEEK